MRLVREAREHIRQLRNGREWGPLLECAEELCGALEEANERIRELEELLATYRMTTEAKER